MKKHVLALAIASVPLWSLSVAAQDDGGEVKKKGLIDCSKK